MHSLSLFCLGNACMQAGRHKCLMQWVAEGKNAHGEERKVSERIEKYIACYGLREEAGLL